MTSMSTTETGKALKITLVKSGICCPESHKKILRALGLKRRGRSITKADQPAIRGMISHVSYLLSVEEIKKK